MKRVRDLASTKMAVNSRRARVACVIPSRLSSTSSRRALQSMSLTKDPQGRDMERPYFRAFVFYLLFVYFCRVFKISIKSTTLINKQQRAFLLYRPYLATMFGNFLVLLFSRLIFFFFFFFFF
ncbi:unnamed protein product [Brassica oleracea var. botrytis]